MRKMLSPIIYLLFLLLTPLTVFAIPTANVSLLGSGPGDYNFEFENTTSATGYDIYWIQFEYSSDAIVSNFVTPNLSWEFDLTSLPLFFTWDGTLDLYDHSNMILSGCSSSCIGNVSFDTDKPVDEFFYTLFFTDPTPSATDPIIISGTVTTTSVPEPSTIFLFCTGVGIVGMLVFLRRFYVRKFEY